MKDESRPAQGVRRGFDVVLGNPPWERIKLQEKEWFAERSPEIAAAPNAAARKRLIAALVQEQPELHAAFLADARKAEGESHLIRNSSRFPLCGRGDVNTYTIFAESMRDAIGPAGRVGVIVPSGIATDDTTKHFFRELVDTASLVSLYDFENRAGIFPDVDSRYKFCLLTLGRAVEPTRFAFFLHAVSDLSDPERVFTLSAEDIALLNPNTRTCPIFRSRHDAELTKAIYRRVPVLIREADPATGAPEVNPWGVKFLRMFDMSNDSHLFRTREQLEAEGFVLEGNVFRKRGSREVGSREVGSREVGSSEVGRMANGESPMVEEYLPLYEGRMIDHFDHRVASVGVSEEATFRAGVTLDTKEADHEDPTYFVLPRYWTAPQHVIGRVLESYTRSWFLGFKDVTSATNERTFISSVFRLTGVGNKVPLLLTDITVGALTGLVANLSSFAFDFMSRQKTGGVTLNFFIVRQLPVVLPEVFSLPCPWACIPASDHSPFAIHDSPNHSHSLTIWLFPRVLELTYTAWDLEPFALDCGYAGPPFRWDEERRFLLRAELDAAFFHLYLRADEQGDWVPARKADGCPYDEASDDLARLKASFPTPRDAVSYIMDTFPIVRRKDEEKYNGDYRTKRVILEIYDAMQESIRTGAPYQTRLDPPPGPPAAWEAASQVEATSSAESGSDSAPVRWIAPQWLPGAPRPADWPSHIHPPRDVREEREAVGPAIIVPAEELDLDRLLAAFREVRGGMSADFVVADPETNRRFQDSARELGLRADPTRLNQALLNARKAGKLKDDPSDRAYRLNRQYEPYVFASEWAVRHLQRQLLAELDRLPALDELLCNPEWAARFDEIVARIKPGFAPIDYRWAALSFRKRGRSKLDDAALDLPLDRQLTLGDWAKPLAPTGPGLYLICSDDRPTYVNWSSNLNDQIARHKEVAGDELVPPWLVDGFGRASRIEYAEFLHRPPKQLQEMRIMQVAKLKPWLNLLDFGDAA